MFGNMIPQKELNLNGRFQEATPSINNLIINDLPDGAGPRKAANGEVGTKK